MRPPSPSQADNAVGGKGARSSLLPELFGVVGDAEDIERTGHAKRALSDRRGSMPASDTGMRETVAHTFLAGGRPVAALRERIKAAVE